MKIIREPDDIQIKILALEQALARRQGKRAVASRGLQFADRRMTARDGGTRLKSVTTEGLYVTDSTIEAFTALFGQNRRAR